MVHRQTFLPALLPAAVTVVLAALPAPTQQTLPQPGGKIISPSGKKPTTLPGIQVYPPPATQPPATQPAPTTGAKPSLEPVAETKLLMEGLAHTNFRGLERQLKQKPEDVQAWTFARGQALLIAETGNLLMLRPPKGQGQTIWFDHAMQLRQTATNLAQATAGQDFSTSRKLLVNLANRCNACHQSFRVPVEIVPFEQKQDQGSGTGNRD
jgi:hypothetical protein